MADWTAAMEEVLEMLYRDTRLSNAQMAERINEQFREGVSRNAVIGKVNRMALAVKYPGIAYGRGKQNGHSAVAPVKRKPPPLATKVYSIEEVKMRAEPVQKPEPEVVSLPPSFRDLLDDGKAVDIMALRDGVCRWPLGEVDDHPPYMYCGRATDVKVPYCPHHMGINKRKYGS